VRKPASDVITQKLTAGGIVVKEVMLPDIRFRPNTRRDWDTGCAAQHERGKPRPSGGRTG